MIITTQFNNENYRVDLGEPINLAHVVRFNEEENPNCFYASMPIAEPIRSGNFIGSRKHGSPLNFFKIQMTPHGNGTHTESVGHINMEMTPITDVLKQYHFFATLISIQPEPEILDLVILPEQIPNELPVDVNALIIRTQRNSQQLKFSGANPPFISKEAMEKIVHLNIDHLLLDLPSVDKEVDGGLLVAHKTFWGFEHRTDSQKTITELLKIPDHVEDGNYLLNLQIPALQIDAVPSQPTLYRLEMVLED